MKANVLKNASAQKFNACLWFLRFVSLLVFGCFPLEDFQLNGILLYFLFELFTQFQSIHQILAISERLCSSLVRKLSLNFDHFVLRKGVNLVLLGHIDFGVLILCVFKHQLVFPFVLLLY